MKPMTANDNVPLGYSMPLGYNFPEGTSLEAIRKNNASTAPNPRLTTGDSKNPKRQEPKPKALKHKTAGGRLPVYILLLIWFLVAAIIARFAGGADDNLISGTNLVSAASGFGLLSLWLASLARRRRAKISYSLAVAGACLSVTGLSWLYFSQDNIQTNIQANHIITPELLVVGLAAICLVFAKLWRTSFLLHLSLFMTIGWTGYVFLGTRGSEIIWLFPALWSLQMFLAMNFRITRSIALSIFAGVFWIGVNLSSLV